MIKKGSHLVCRQSFKLLLWCLLTPHGGVMAARGTWEVCVFCVLCSGAGAGWVAGRGLAFIVCVIRKSGLEEEKAIKKSRSV